MTQTNSLDLFVVNTCRRIIKYALFATIVFSLLACQEADNTRQATSETNIQLSEPTKPSTPASFKAIEWTDLMPKSDLDAILNTPSYVTEIEDGSEADQISGKLQNKSEIVKDDAYQRALVSTNVVPDMNNQAIRIPGFIVPLSFNEKLAVTQFFLVPFFGACIHVPPPPPNQIIFVDYPKGIEMGDMYNPIWVSGTLKTKLVENDTATSAYSLKMHAYETYTEDGLDGP